MMQLLVLGQYVQIVVASSAGSRLNRDTSWPPTAMDTDVISRTSGHALRIPHWRPQSP